MKKAFNKTDNIATYYNAEYDYFIYFVIWSGQSEDKKTTSKRTFFINGDQSKKTRFVSEVELAETGEDDIQLIYHAEIPINIDITDKNEIEAFIEYNRSSWLLDIYEP